jgi:heme-degrading monooxygenase HmoA
VVTVISRFRVRNGQEEEVRAAFLNRPRLVEEASGFCGLEVVTDASDAAVFLLITRWRDEASFRAWHRSEAHHASHGRMPQGLKLDPTFRSLTVGNRIEDCAGVQHLSDAMEGQTAALLGWLMESDAVFALLVAPDGAIRVGNRAARRIFPADPAKNCIWDYVQCSDTQALRQRMAGSGNQEQGCLRLNLTDAQQNPVTLEVGLVACSGGVLLLGARTSQRCGFSSGGFEADRRSVGDDARSSPEEPGTERGK